MKKMLAQVAMLVFAAISVAAFARTPAPGSMERTAILNALRPSVEGQLGPNIEFVIQSLDVENGWAFVQAMPQRRGGGQIDWRRYYTTSEWEHMDGLTITALLQYRYKRWNLVEKAIGATDAWYCDMPAGRAIKFCR